MSKEYSFSVMPSVSISRSRFARKSQHKTSFNIGDIIPIYCDEVLPGDTRSIDMASLVRMSTPIAPIMDNIFVDYYAFFVPNRIVWDHWKEFMGENSVSAGIPQQSYSVPKLKDTSTPGKGIAQGSYADYLGLPIGTNGSLVKHNAISALPFRGLAKIYNRWFRNQNTNAPLAVYTGDQNQVLVGDGLTTYCPFAVTSGGIMRASKVADYFTSSLPYAQKGSAVSIPLGTYAPIVLSPNIASNTNSWEVKNTSGTGSNSGTLVSYYNSEQEKFLLQVADDGNYPAILDPKGTLVADLANATGATINNLRYAFQLQKFLEKDALYGTRYWEILAAHFGVHSPDATLQEPEYLGGFRQHVNIDQVLSTTGYTADSQSDLGKPGANSVTGSKSSLFTKSFVEHGYIFIIAVARHDQTYCQGINRMWSRQSRYDYYFPVFANLGAQSVLNKEIYAQGTDDDDGLFAYQEAWAEYRYKPSIATGLLRPTASGALDFWTLTNKFAELPTISDTFIEQSRDNIKRALVTGESGPDFIADFYFQDIAVRPMPMYSIPGLIDHH